MVAFLAGLAFARGVIRQLVGMVSLGLSLTVAFYVYRHRSEVFGAMGTTMTTDRLMMFSAGAGLLTYFICKGVIHLLAGFGILNLLGGLAGWKGLMLSVIPSGFLLWAGSMALRLTGNVAGVESAAEVAKQGSNIQTQVTSWLHKLSQQVDHSTFGSLAEKLDPYDMRATANLARLLILWPDGTVWQQLAAQNPKTALMLNNPMIVQLGSDAKVRQAIDRQDFAGLMQLPQIEKTASDPEINAFLKGLALEQAMDAIIYKQQPARGQPQQPAPQPFAPFQPQPPAPQSTRPYQPPRVPAQTTSRPATRQPKSQYPPAQPEFIPQGQPQAPYPYQTGQPQYQPQQPPPGQIQYPYQTQPPGGYPYTPQQPPPGQYNYAPPSAPARR